MNTNFTSRTTGKTTNGISFIIQLVILSLLILCIHTFLPWFFQFIPAGISIVLGQLHVNNKSLNIDLQAIPVFTRSIPAQAAGHKA